MVKAARSVLIELVRLLGEYRDDIVLIGGWVPELLFPDAETPHVGSIDVDLALDHRKLRDEGYRTIREHLLGRGYVEGRQPFIFLRTIGSEGGEIVVEVDLLAGEYEGTVKSRRHQQVQGVHARKARGSELALELAREMTIEGELPGGGKDTVSVRVATIVPFLVMKGMAMHDRLKEKDAWDIYYCVRRYPGGVDALAQEFRRHLDHGLVREGLEKIARKFGSAESTGPKHVADFEELSDPEERSRVQRDAFERINALLEKMDFRKDPSADKK